MLTRDSKLFVHAHHSNISLKKGCRGNNAGDGPRVAESGRQKGLNRNGFALIGLRNRSIPNSHFAVSEVVAEVLQRKFGTNDIPLVNSMILEINHELIQFYKKSVVNKMISDSDVIHLKYVNPDELREREIYSLQHFNVTPPSPTGKTSQLRKWEEPLKTSYCRNTADDNTDYFYSFATEYEQY
jgi:hypothetical protein